MRRLKEFLRRYFIPHEGNEYKPHILQKGAILGILFLLLSTFATVNISSLLLVSSETFSGAILPAVLVDLTNGNRTGESLRPLKRSVVLDEAARLKAEDMAAKGYFAHQSPDGQTPWYWFERVGYEYVFAGENLAVHFSDSDRVVDAWMKSEGHRANILSSNYTEIGIGTARGRYKDAPTVFVVQLFGRPISEDERAEVAKLSLNRYVNFPEAKEGIVEGESTSSPVLLKTTVTKIQEEAETQSKPTHIGVAMGAGLPSTTPILSLEVTDEITPSVVRSPDTDRVLVETLPETATVSPLVTGGVIRPIKEMDITGVDDQSTPLEKVAVRPHTTLLLIYSIVATLIYVAVVLSIVIEWRRQHPVGMLYGACLLAALFLTLLVHEKLLAGVLIL